MPRTRLLKPDFFRDEELCILPFDCRLLFAGLWVLADKEGRLEYSVKRIDADLFPFDEDVPVEKYLSILEGKFITIYEVDFRKYIQINNFLKHQKPHMREADSIIPRMEAQGVPKALPQAQPRQVLSPEKVVPQPQPRQVPSRAVSITVSDTVSVSDSVSDTDTVPHPPKAHASKKTSILPPGFLRFWDEWPKHPRKCNRTKCVKFWEKHGCEHLQDQIVDSVRILKSCRDWTKDAGQFIPAPLVWLGRESWEAPLETAPQGGTGPQSPSWGESETFQGAPDYVVRDSRTEAAHYDMTHADYLKTEHCKDYFPKEYTGGGNGAQ